MSEGDDSFELSTDGKSVSTKLKGEAASRIGHGFADLISPFTEFGGAIGDQVRFFRQANALRALEKANKIATESGLNIKPVAPKFLIQWTENASLEEEGDDDLSDLWANLLVSESVEKKPAHLFYMSILRQLTYRHIQLLKELCKSKDGNVSFEQTAINKGFDGYYKIYSQLTKEPQRVECNDMETLSGIVAKLDQVGIKNTGFEVTAYDENKGTYATIPELEINTHSGFYQDGTIYHLRSIGILETLNLPFNIDASKNPIPLEKEFLLVVPTG